MQEGMHSLSSQPSGANNQDGSADIEAEVQLLSRVAQGDKAALQTLFATYGERVFRYALRLVGDTGKAEEVTNDVF